MDLDLADVADVKRFLQQLPRGIDVLICNAGVMCPPTRTLTRDGMELQFQVRRVGGR